MSVPVRRATAPARDVPGASLQNRSKRSIAAGEVIKLPARDCEEPTVPSG